MSITENLARLREEIARACNAAGRRPEEIILVAVSKTFPAEKIREGYQAGLRRVGENRVQELVAKKEHLEDLDLEWHLVGSLQTNKVKAVLPHISVLHSLDRISLARAIERHRSRHQPLPCLVQVNTTAEESKSGVSPEGLDPLVDEIREIPTIRLQGLMTIGPLVGSEADIRRSFALLRELRDRSALRHPDLDLSILSMGMSDDFPLAILEGATHLRIGSRIFGARGAAGA